MTEATRDDLRAAVLTLAEALDPSHQGEGWPDPIAWDGRPLEEQAHDLLVLADAERDECRWDDLQDAALMLRRALVAREVD